MTQANTPRQTLTSATTDALRQRILMGEWPAGTQLRQEALSKELGVSRVPLREALRQLEAEGLVAITERRGAVIAQLSLPEVLELLRVRVLLECDMLLEAVPRQTQADLDAAGAFLAQFEDALHRRDVGTWGILNCRFHLALYQAANRPQTLALIEQLHNRTDRYTRMQILLTNFSDRAHREHSEMLELCRRKDAVSAAAFLRQHILNAEEALEAWHQTHQGESGRGVAARQA
ncbi:MULTISPECIES: GntR family transcriptional regulator [Chromobacterium]|uniref:GntR family transcriptional regulator n=1 Tax=Chromobacterium aquaticum TaxID=467180 RepID=A0ABV8ZRN6_9NEIS|nr:MULTISPECIES: GntR family transcriptional regulator [Chromobacterium]KMN35518.1 GntR family transcriptional regulator [Chromobacterium sp. LK1]MCD5362719.1 GntR family transcriptional regulator [Chromobacterium aquaticum]